MLYYCTFFVSAFIAKHYQNRNAVVVYQNNESKNVREHQIIIIVLIGFLPILLSCLRYGIGMDYNNYQLYFEHYKNYGVVQFVNATGTYEIFNLIIIKIGYFI